MAFEMGHAWTGNAGHAYGNGFGRTLMFGVNGFEARLLETYDLEDLTGMLDARGKYGKLGMSSFGYRLRYQVGPLALRPLLGVTWLRRSAHIREDELLLERRTQHGLAMQAGVGLELRLRRVSFGFDLRAYPTLLWSELSGELTVVRDGELVYEPITESPTGMPRTISGWVAIHL